MGRYATKFASITDDDRVWLEELWRSDAVHSARCRAHAILLSSQRFSILEISSIFNVTYETVDAWIDRWNQHGRDGLFDGTRSGRPPILDDKDRKVIRSIVDEHPQEPNIILNQIEERTKKKISRVTLRRTLRSMGYRWKRLRLSLRNRRDSNAFEIAARELKEMEQIPDANVVYFDESHFTISGVVSYAWQPKGERTLIPLSGGSRKSIQVLGFQSINGRLRSYVQHSSVRGSTVVAAIEDYIKTIKTTTVLVLDNASSHTCNEVKFHLQRWVEKGLILYHLPPYSPELNSIEHLWNKLKHQLMPRTAWETIDRLTQSLLDTLKKIGTVKQLEPIAAL